jgi:endonuclease III
MTQTQSRSRTQRTQSSRQSGDRAKARALLRTHGQTYAEQAGITLRDTPSPLYRLLVLSLLLSARIRSDIAVASSRALSDAGMKDARRMAEATWQQRVDALGVGGYRRYDERTATQLGEGAELLLSEYKGDLRRMREDPHTEERLREVPGIGPTGVDIFLREAQEVWPEFGPYFDQKAQQGAQRLGLPTSPSKLAALVPSRDRARFAAALVRAALDKKVVDDAREAA